MGFVGLPLVSVVVPFLNEDRFLSETVESVLRQTYTHWELLLVDDGSTNASTTIAKNFASSYPDKIFYLEHEGHANKGVCISRNLGVEKAKGNLIALLDADDVWLPGKLTDQVNIFQQHPDIAMVAEASNYWSTWEDPQLKDIIVPVGAPPDKVYEPKELLYHLYPLRKGAAPCPSGLLVTRASIIRSGGFEPLFTKEYQLYEDQAFLIKMYINEKVYVSSSRNNLYRQRPGSVVKKVHADGQYHIVRKFFMEWLAQYLETNQVNDRGVQKLFREASFPYRFPKLHFIMKDLPRKVKRMIKKKLIAFT